VLKEHSVLFLGELRVLIFIRGTYLQYRKCSSVEANGKHVVLISNPPPPKSRSHCGVFVQVTHLNASLRSVVASTANLRNIFHLAFIK
jgi:hypothetical protein